MNKTYKTGLYNISNEDYHGCEGLSNSSLSLLIANPAKFKAQVVDKAISRKETPAQAFGSLAHKVMFEASEMDKEFVCEPEVNKRTKEGKAVYAEFVAQNSGKTIVSSSEMQKAFDMKAVITQNPLLKKLIEKGVAEQSMFLQDDDLGTLLKIRPDYVIKYKNGDVIVDYKTTVDCSPKEFSKSIAKFGYYRQNALYKYVYEKVTGRKLKAFVFLAQEKEAPYLCNAYTIEDFDVDLGMEHIKDAIKTYNRCLKTGDWGDKPNKITTLSLPHWMHNKES